MAEEDIGMPKAAVLSNSLGLPEVLLTPDISPNLYPVVVVVGLVPRHAQE